MDINLKSGNVVQLLTDPNLFALEIDVDKALEEFKQSIGPLLDTEALSQSLGVPRNIIEAFGLEDIADLFTNPPPGIDEIVGIQCPFRSIHHRFIEVPPLPPSMPPSSLP